MAQPDGPAAGSISFANLDDTDFEEFCHDLLVELGFVNVDWRKGTPKKASPSDRGRDLVAQREQVDVDGHRRFETWFVDYGRNRRPPFRIRHWEKPTLARLLRNHPGLLQQHGIFVKSMRTTAEILKAEQEFFDKIWYVRKIILQEKIEDGHHEPLPPVLRPRCRLR